MLDQGEPVGFFWYPQIAREGCKVQGSIFSNSSVHGSCRLAIHLSFPSLNSLSVSLLPRTTLEAGLMLHPFTIWAQVFSLSLGFSGLMNAG